MKKDRLYIIVLCVLIIMLLSGFYFYNLKYNKKNNEAEKPSYNFEKCEGSTCDETIELLKNTESAWHLTELDSKGEYISTNSFINFQGAGINKFAFFLNDDKYNSISEVVGEFIINEQNEIILIPNDGKKQITCKLGKEQDLVAFLFCDNDFGLFALQKDGTIELPDIIIDTLSKTKKIKIRGYESHHKGTKTIKEEKELNEFLTLISNSKVWTGAINLPGPLYEIELLNDKNKCIAEIRYNPSHYFTIEINEKSYQLTDIDTDSLNTLLAK